MLSEEVQTKVELCLTTARLYWHRFRLLEGKGFMNKSLLMAAAVFITSTSISQDVKKKIEALQKDPKTMENSAKADVLIIDKKQIADSSMVKKIPPSTTTTVYKPAIKKKKRTKKN